MALKKLYCLLVCLLSIIMPTKAKVFSIGEFDYSITDSVNLTVQLGSIYVNNEISGDITVPESVEIEGKTYTVTSAHFNSSKEVTSITIPNCVTKISAYRCDKLTSINIPDSVTYISFTECKSLASVTIPSTVTSLPSYAFYKCESLTSINVPNSVTSIGNNAFDGCYNLTSINIPDSVEVINGSTFFDCYGLTSITIPNSVTSIKLYAFSNCENLKQVYIPNSVSDINRSAFSDGTIIYGGTASGSPWGAKRHIKGSVIDGDFVYVDEKKDVLAGYIGSDSVISISNTVTSIMESAFRDNTVLTSVSIPNSVTSIGNDAFSGCVGLKSVVIPNTVTSLGQGAFFSVDTIYYGRTTSSNMWGARRHIKGYYKEGDFIYADEKMDTLVAYLGADTIVTIPSSVVSIGYSAFYKCKDLTSIIIPNTVTSISDYAFYGCESLKAISIPDHVSTIGEYAFWGCNSLTSVNIPSSVTYIRKYTFYRCKNLKSITIPSSVDSIGENAFYYCTGLAPVVIPSSVTYMGYQAFYDVCAVCYLGEPIGADWNWAKRSIKDGFVNGDFVYKDEQNDTLIAYIGAGPFASIPNHVKVIDKNAFNKTTWITSVSIPSSVTSIGYNAFYSIDTICYVGSATGSPWGAKHHIKLIVDGDFIYGDEEKTLLKQYIGNDSLVFIPNHVKTIGDSAFYNNSSIRSVVIPNSVTSIGSYAFAGCTNISRLSVPCTVSYIWEYAFYQVDTVSYGGLQTNPKLWGALHFEDEGDDLYIIHNLEELLFFRDSVKGIARLEADIDLSPVCGKLGDDIVSFTPIRCLKFDGGNHTISNLYINNSHAYETALFDVNNQIYKLAVKNLKVTNAYVKGGDYAAGIAINGEFTNCHFEGVVIGIHAGGVSEYGKPSSAYNCSNYGMIVAWGYASGIDASSMVNCYNRGRIVSDDVAIGLGMYDGFHFNIYNSGDVYSPGSKTTDYIETGYDYGSLFVLQEMDSAAFLSGAVTDSLNLYVSQNPKPYSNYLDSVSLHSWVQGEDGFPRFEGVDLKPTQGYVVRYTGAVDDIDVALDGTVILPVCSISGNSYVFSDNFDGKNIVSDTVVNVKLVSPVIPVNGQIAGHDYVDLGLPSGTLWATYNVGATKPEEDGNHFAWGETKPKDVYDWSTYKWYDTSSERCTKYDSGSGMITLLPEDDAAVANWGTEWRMPTFEEIEELDENCEYSFVEVDGVKVAKYTATNGNFILFPFVSYWSSSRSDDSYYAAQFLWFLEEYGAVLDKCNSNRSNGYSVRAVATGNPTSASIIKGQAVEVYVGNCIIYVANAEAKTNIQVFDMNGKIVASAVADDNRKAEIKLSGLKGVYVITVGNQSTKVILK